MGGRGSSSAGAAQGALTAPAPLRNVSVQSFRSYLSDNGLKIADASSLAVGTPVVYTEPIMNSPLDSRRDPSGVRFVKGYFAGTTSLGVPLVKRSAFTVSVPNNGVRVDTEMPHEKILVRKRSR